MAEGIPMLGEHEARGGSNTATPAGYTPTPEEKKLIKKVDGLFSKAKAHRKKFDEHWLDYYRAWRGKQWKENRPSYRHSEVLNLIWQTIQSEVPVITDARQRFEFQAQEPQDAPFAKVLEELAESDWDRQSWTFRLAECVYDAHFYGTGLGEMGFDPKARFGLGDITFESKDPFYCFPDPDAQDINDARGRYFIYAEPVDLDQLKREYPDKAKWLKPDLIDLVQGEKADLDQVRFVSPVDASVPAQSGGVYDQNYRNQAFKITAWIKDDEILEDKKEEQDPQTGEIRDVFEQRLKYPNGRKVCIASGIVLDDGPNPYEDGLFPFARFVNYVDPRSFWGISEVEPILGPQKILNKVYSFILDVLELTGNPVWIVPTSTGIDTDNMTTRPGLIIETEGEKDPYRVEGTQLQPYVMNIMERVTQHLGDIAGTQEVSRGAKPDGVTAASAISALQEAAQTRSRQKSRNLDAGLQQLGQLYKNRAFQFFSAPRVTRMTGDENAGQYFKFQVESVQDKMGQTYRKATVRPFSQDPATGEYAESLEAREYLIQGDFDVKVATGSALPFAKEVKFNRARQMFLDGVIDQEEYLKASDYPNWQAIMLRMQEKAMQMQAAQMQAEQAKAQPTPAPAAAPGV